VKQGLENFGKNLFGKFKKLTDKKDSTSPDKVTEIKYSEVTTETQNNLEQEA
jgi:hypothetical protein